MQGETFKKSAAVLPSVFYHARRVPPNYIAESAENNKHCGGCGYECVPRIIAKAVIAYNIHTRIAKCRYRIEDRNPNSLCAELRNKHEHIKACADSFDRECPRKHLFNEGHNSRKGIEVKGVLNQQAVGNIDFSVKQEHHGGHKGDYAESSYLNQEQNYNLSEYTPRGCRADGDKPRDACGSGCGEKRVNIRQSTPIR